MNEDTDRYTGEALREDIDLGNGKAMPLAPHVMTSIASNGMIVKSRLADGWLVAMRVVRLSTGAYGIVEMTLMADAGEDLAGLSTTHLRTASLAPLMEAARAHAQELDDLMTEEAALNVEPLLDVWRGDARTTGARRDALAYAALAARYSQLVQSGDRKPAETLGEELGLSPVTVSQRVREARTQGLLTPVSPGRAGGRLTPEALRLLQDVVTDPQSRQAATPYPEEKN